jgi:hypothetical protein
MKEERKVRVMANENLISLGDRTTAEQREIARQGGIKSGEARRARKTLKETLLMMLEEGDTQNNITLALLDKALKGDTKAYEVIRDTVGEKPTDKVDIGNKDNKPFQNVDFSHLSVEQIKELLKNEDKG